MKKQAAKLVTILALSGTFGLGHAQAYYGQEFDNMFWNQLYGMMGSMQQQQVQLLQTYMHQFGPQLQHDYQQFVQSFGYMPFEQFAYYHLMTAGGTNPGPGLRAQQDSFNALQQSHGELQQSYDAYNQSWWDNQASLDQTFQNYSDYAVRGNAYYSNPYTADVHTLPYTSGPGYYQVGQDYFYMDQTGSYWQFQGGYWYELNPHHP